MKVRKNSLLATAALTGLLTGAVANKTYGADAKKETKPGKEAAAKKVPTVHDCAGENDCKGVGGCKTTKHECKGLNDCKGLGGCHISKEDVKNWEKITKKAAKKEAK